MPELKLALPADVAPALPAGLGPDRHIWELRKLWAKHRPVALVLTDRCVVQVVKGPIRTIAVTGAFVVVDGWQIPVGEILSVTIPTVADLEQHRQKQAEAAYFVGEDHA